MLHFTEPKALGEVLGDLPISSFIAGLLTQKDSTIVAKALQLAEILMHKLPGIFSKYFLKEGVVHAVEQLAASSPQLAVEEKAKSKAAKRASQRLKVSRLCLPNFTIQVALGLCCVPDESLARAYPPACPANLHPCTFTCTSVHCQCQMFIMLEILHWSDLLSGMGGRLKCTAVLRMQRSLLLSLSSTMHTSFAPLLLTTFLCQHAFINTCSVSVQHILASSLSWVVWVGSAQTDSTAVFAEQGERGSQGKQGRQG